MPREHGADQQVAERDPAVPLVLLVRAALEVELLRMGAHDDVGHVVALPVVDPRLGGDHLGIPLWREVAEDEVRRLNALNAGKGAYYFAQVTRIEKGVAESIPVQPAGGTLQEDQG